MVFLLLSPLWVCRIGKKKSHTFAEQWDNNQLHDTNWFLISERFSWYDSKSEPYINKWKKPIATWLKRTFPTIFDCDDNFTPLIPLFPWLSVGCCDNFGTGFTAPDCRAPVLNHHNTIEPGFEIYFLLKL